MLGKPGYDGFAPPHRAFAHLGRPAGLPFGANPSAMTGPGKASRIAVEPISSQKDATQAIGLVRRSAGDEARMSEERILRVPGADLKVAMRKGLPPTVFLHGFGGSLRTWDKLCPLLPLGRGYVRYDLRGFGQSVAHDDRLFHHADDLLALIDALRIDRCDLVGLSMGGSVALNFALSRPDRVRSLSLLSPGLTGWDWSDEWRSQWRPIVAAAKAGDMPRACEMWLAHPLFSTTFASDAKDMLHKEVMRFSGDQWLEDRQATALPDVERLHELVAPLLLLTGARDLADFRLIAKLIAACGPDVTWHDAPDLGHLIHLEAPRWCAEMLTAFWSGHET